MSAKSLIEEIKSNHYSSERATNKAHEDKVVENSKSSQGEVKKIRKRRSRIASPGCKSGTSMYTVTIIGGINLPGYDLLDGEKLAIAKLSPVNIGT